MKIRSVSVTPDYHQSANEDGFDNNRPQFLTQPRFPSFESSNDLDVEANAVDSTPGSELFAHDTVQLSQELPTSSDDSSDDSFAPSPSLTVSDSVGFTDENSRDRIIGDGEIEDFYRESEHMRTTMTDVDVDMFSNLFDNIYDDVPSLSHNNVLEETSENERWNVNGLEGWKYCSGSESHQLGIDDVDAFLFKRFMVEVQHVLHNVTSAAELQRKLLVSEKKELQTQLSECSPIAILRCFLTQELLQLVATEANYTLAKRNAHPTNWKELEQLLIFHALCSTYNQAPSKVVSEKKRHLYFHMGTDVKRYNEVLSALSGTSAGRVNVTHDSFGWSLKCKRANELIMRLEDGIASVNRSLLYCQEGTICSVDDDHLRLTSKAVYHMTELRVINNPKKALGPVCNALCSALLSFYICGHHSRPKEGLLDVWNRLLLLLQGRPTVGCLQPMSNAIFASDRGYNTMQTVKFLTEEIQADFIGTFKRSYDYPFVFGEGPVRSRHKGRAISEKGCGTVQSAILSLRHGQSLEAALYRESYSGRIVATLHNNKRLFGSNKLTLVPKERFRRHLDEVEMEAIQIVYQENEYYLRRKRKRSTATTPIYEKTPAGIVRQHLSRVNQLTLLQSEDPCWFLMRAFSFTSRTTFAFLKTVFSDFEKNMLGMAYLLKSKELLRGSVHFSSHVSEVRNDIVERWKSVSDGLRINIYNKPTPSELEKDTLIGMEVSTIRALRIVDLVKYLRVFEVQYPSGTRKQQLVELVCTLRSNLISGRLSVIEHTQSEEEMAKHYSANLLTNLRKASLSGWVMRPLVKTDGMKEGTLNEVEVLKRLPEFLNSARTMYESGSINSSGNTSTERLLKLRCIRCVGLLNSPTHPLISDSPDAIAALEDELGRVNVVSIEVKTMTSVSTISAAEQIRDSFDKVILVHDIGLTNAGNDIFSIVVSNSSYRAQCLHHAATTNSNTVLYTTAKGGRTTHSSILFVAVLHFSDRLIHNYLYTLDTIHISAFLWIGKDAKQIPNEYDDLVQNTFASDIHSFASYYNMSTSIKKHVIQTGLPITPARMVRPSVLVFWNAVKGGVDEYSRNMTHLTHHNVSQNPLTTVVLRLLMSQIHNAAVAYKLCLASLSGVVSSLSTDYDNNRRGGKYKSLRHRITSTASMIDFVHTLATDYYAYMKIGSENVSDEQGEKDNTLQNSSETSVIKARFTRNIIEKFNFGDLKQLRLSPMETHQPAKGRKVYCALCSWSRMEKPRRGGSHQRQWCLKCRQSICVNCWNKWHSEPILHRAIPPPIQR